MSANMAIGIALFFTVMFIVLAGCTTQPIALPTCVTSAQGYSAQPPCWISEKPKQGKVMIGNKHAGADGWARARKSLLNRAMLEFANARSGRQVDARSKVTSSTTVNSIRGRTGSNNEQVRQRVANVVVAEIYTPVGGVNVKAEIKDYFYYPQTEKIYLWVIEK